MKREHKTAAERLAALIVGMDREPMEERTLQAARLCLLDTLGVGLYGGTQPEAEAILRAAVRLGRGEAPVWGREEKLEAGMAAMVCGALCHLRELDDVHYAILHTGCVCVPAALTAALEGADLGQLLRALVKGTEAMARISLGMDYMEHRERGWHGTATCGAFGAAAAVGALLGLDAEQMADALGTAGSRTGGTWAFSADGAMSKRLHPGLAARDGLLAAYLAREGIPGPRYVLEAEDGGFFRLFAPEWDVERMLAAGECPEIEHVEFKWFASCKSVHSPITAALELHSRHPERRPEDVAGVRVEVNYSALSMAGHPYTEDSVVSAQISIPHGVALGLLGRSGRAEDYTLDSLKDPAVRALADLVRVEESEEFNRVRHEQHLSGARVTVEWKDGTRDSAVVTRPKGALGNPLSREDVVEKYSSLAAAALGRERAQELRELVLEGAEETPVARLLRLLEPVKR